MCACTLNGACLCSCASARAPAHLHARAMSQSMQDAREFLEDVDISGDHKVRSHRAGSQGAAAWATDIGDGVAVLVEGAGATRGRRAHRGLSRPVRGSDAAQRACWVRARMHACAVERILSRAARRHRRHRRPPPCPIRSRRAQSPCLHWSKVQDSVVACCCSVGASKADVARSMNG